MHLSITSRLFHISIYVYIKSCTFCIRRSNFNEFSCKELKYFNTSELIIYFHSVLSYNFNMHRRRLIKKLCAFAQVSQELTRLVNSGLVSVSVMRFGFDSDLLSAVLSCLSIVLIRMRLFVVRMCLSFR